MAGSAVRRAPAARGDVAMTNLLSKIRKLRSKVWLALARGAREQDVDALADLSEKLRAAENSLAADFRKTLGRVGGRGH